MVRGDVSKTRFETRMHFGAVGKVQEGLLAHLIGGAPDWSETAPAIVRDVVSDDENSEKIWLDFSSCLSTIVLG